MILGRYLTIFFQFLIVTNINGQYNGNETFAILNFPTGTRIIGLGGVNVSLAHGDINMARANPAAVDSVDNSDFSIQVSPFFGDLRHYSIAGSFQISDAPIVGYLSYLDYGDFIRRDDLGTQAGSFSPKDYVIGFSTYKTIQGFTFGLSTNFVESTIDGYGSSALFFNIGGIYTHPSMDISFAVVAKNFGFKFSDFDTYDAKLPFQLQMGVSYKPKYMPARLSITGSNLFNGHFDYFNVLVGDEQSISEIENFFRHVTFGLELLLSRKFSLLLGYDHLKNQELRQSSNSLGIGISLGVLIRIIKFEVCFSHTRYHLAGVVNSFGIQGNLKSLFKLF